MESAPSAPSERSSAAPPHEVATQRFADAAAREAVEERTSDRLGNVRLVLAMITLVLVLLPLGVRASWPWWSLIPITGIFLVLGRWHDSVTQRQRRFSAARRYWRAELDRLEEKWRELEDDGADVSPRALAKSAASNGNGHTVEDREAGLLAGDLDLFGPASLFQLLNRAHTPHGRRTLARWLVHPARPEEALARQGAVRELAEAIEQREALAIAALAEGQGKLSDAALLAWGEHPEPMPLGGLLRVVGVVQPLILIGAGVAWALGAPAIVFFAALVLHIAVLLAVRAPVGNRAAALSTPDRALTRYADLIAVIERGGFRAAELLAVKKRLEVEGQPASERIRALRRLVELLEQNHNMFFALSLGPLLLWDLNIVLRAEKWQKITGHRLRGWFEAIGEIEALSSLGAFSFERPDYGFPVFTEEEGVFRATGISHPLIDRGRVVDNDLELAGPGSVLLLSGSNMSGKSTLLRSIGLNVVLAQAGAPVAARSLVTSAFTLSTSIRVTDSLAQGASHFYAELQRIKSALEVARVKGAHLLYLLDEMLHGTNSRERYIGAVSVIRWLSQQRAMGVVTTHDLALARVAEELPGKVINRHFGDEVIGDQIRFDYKLRDGAVRSTNALRLMRAIGIDIELSAPE